MCRVSLSLQLRYLSKAQHKSYRLCSVSACSICCSSSIIPVERSPPGKSSAAAFILSSVVNSSLAYAVSSASRAFPKELTEATTSFAASTGSTLLSCSAIPANFDSIPSTTGRTETNVVGEMGDVHVGRDAGVWGAVREARFFPLGKEGEVERARAGYCISDIEGFGVDGLSWSGL
jgi:hypothetical protein